MIMRSLKIFTAILGLSLAVACGKEELSGSIFQDPEERTSEFDLWLQRNYVDPFNIRFEYRMPDRETNFSYWVSPPNVRESIMIAKLLKFTTIEAMIEMMASDDENVDPALLVKSYFPKVIFLVGSFEISNTGTTNLASAENGLQINILGVNFFTVEKDAVRIAGTMLHEFTHILDGIYACPAEYKDVTPDGYVGSRYSTLGNDYLQNGYVSNYARSSVAEDIAETCGRLISLTDAEWEAMYAAAGSEAGAKLRMKHEIVRKWLLDSYGVDARKWSEIYHRRISELDSLDWESLDD